MTESLVPAAGNSGDPAIYEYDGDPNLQPRTHTVLIANPDTLSDVLGFSITIDSGLGARSGTISIIPRVCGLSPASIDHKKRRAEEEIFRTKLEREYRRFAWFGQKGSRSESSRNFVIAQFCAVLSSIETSKTSAPFDSFSDAVDVVFRNTFPHEADYQYKKQPASYLQAAWQAVQQGKEAEAKKSLDGLLTELETHFRVGSLGEPTIFLDDDKKISGFFGPLVGLTPADIDHRAARGHCFPHFSLFNTTAYSDPNEGFIGGGEKFVNRMLLKAKADSVMDMLKTSDLISRDSTTRDKVCETLLHYLRRKPLAPADKFKAITAKLDALLDRLGAPQLGKLPPSSGATRG